MDLSIPADSEASLPYLTEAVRKCMSAEQKAKFEARGEKLAAAHKQAARRPARTCCSPGTRARSRPAGSAPRCSRRSATSDWSLASTTGNFVSGWPQRLWDMSKHYHNTGVAGGSGIGYCAPAAAGAAVANKKHGRITVSINPDGDLMYSPGILWTAARAACRSST